MVFAVISHLPSASLPLVRTSNMLCVPVAADHYLRNYACATANVSHRLAEHRPMPANRTHASIVRDGVRERDHRGFKKDAPYKTTGVKELSPLRFVPLFDLTWDIMMDMMHIVPVMWKGHIFKMFAGKRVPATPKPRKTWTPAENATLLQEHEQARAHLAAWELSTVCFAAACPCSNMYHECVSTI